VRNGAVREAQWPRHDADQSPTSRVEVKSDWSYTSTPNICLHGIERDNMFLPWQYIDTKTSH